MTKYITAKVVRRVVYCVNLVWIAPCTVLRLLIRITHSDIHENITQFKIQFTSSLHFHLLFRWSIKTKDSKIRKISELTQVTLHM